MKEKSFMYIVGTVDRKVSVPLVVDAYVVIVNDTT